MCAHAFADMGCRNINALGGMSIQDEFAVYQQGNCELHYLCQPEHCKYNGSFTGSNPNKDGLYCSCHIDCIKYGQCCINFLEACLILEEFPSEFYMASIRNQSNQLNYTDMKRATLENQTFSNGTLPVGEAHQSSKITYHWTNLTYILGEYSKQRTVSCEGWGERVHPMVMKCVRSYMHFDNLTNFAMCEYGASIADIQQLIPVYVNSTIYKNVFCAECSLQESVETAFYLPVGIDCSLDYLQDAYTYAENQNYSGFIKLFNEGLCHTLYNEDLHVPSSPCSTAYIDRCNNSFESEIENFTELVTMCNAYMGLVQGSGSKQGYWFKNIHCAQCNGFSPGDVKCGCSSREDCSFPGAKDSSIFGITPQMPHFSLLMDFSGNVRMEIVSSRICNPVWQVLDLISNQCIDRPCQADYSYISDACVNDKHIQVITMDSRNASPENQYEISFTLYSHESESDTAIPHDIASIISSAMKKANLPVFGYIECMMFGNDRLSSASARVVCINVAPHLNLLITHIFRDHLVLWESIHHAAPAVNKVLVSFGHKVHCSDRSIFVFSHKTKIVSALTTSEQTNQMSTTAQDNSSKIYFPSYGMLLPAEKVYGKIFLDSEGILYTQVEACINVTETCFSNMSQVLGSDGDCVSRVAAKAMRNEHQGYNYLCMSCTAVSIVGLLVTLVIHCTFPKLASAGGNILINLVVSLLGAEIQLLISGMSTRNSVFCTIAAALHHYMWLASFCWMAVLSWDIFKTFATLKLSHKRPLGVYLAAGWLTPAVIVGVCGILHFLGHFQYGDDLICWIVGGLELGVSFGVPVACIIIGNLVLYILTVKRLSGVMTSSTLVGKHYNRRCRFVLYVRLGSSMGFTWIFGFLSNIKVLSFFKYLFALSAGMNGLLICVSFTVNSNVISLVKTRITKK